MYLCEFTKVKITKKANGRTYFTVLENAHKGIEASLSDANAEKCIISGVRSTGATIKVKIIGRKKEFSKIRKEELNQLFAELTYGNKKIRITLDSDVDYVEANPLSPKNGQRQHSKPLPKGTYKILPPTFPMPQARMQKYREPPYGFADLKWDTAWFPIEYAPTYNSNFIHTGHLSEGCITCYNPKDWNALYEYLIKHRTTDGKYVGTLIIS